MKALWSAIFALILLPGCGVQLWCQANDGPACKATAAALDESPAAAADVDADLLSGIHDGEEKACASTDRVRNKLNAAELTTDVEWKPHKGRTLSRQNMGAIPAGGGCSTYSGEPAKPVFKVHATGSSSDVLVRVWEHGSP